MKRFHFALRPVAIVRAHREMQAQRALAEAMRAQTGAEAALAAAQSRSAEMEATIAAERQRPARGDLQVSYLQAYRRQRSAEGDARKELESARAEVARRRTACIEANRQVKIVSRLEERARAAYRADLLRAEQLEIDERAAYTAACRPSPLP